MSTNSENKWFAMKATYNRALSAQKMLKERSIHSFVPMEKRAVSNRNNVKKERLVPVFSNLIFICTTLAKIKSICSVYDYLHYIYTYDSGKNIPVIVPDEQMERFIAIIEGKNNDDIEFIDCNEIDFKSGERVEIIAEGYLKGQIGTFVKIKDRRNRKVVIAIEGVMAIVLTTIRAADIKRIK